MDDAYIYMYILDFYFPRIWFNKIIMVQSFSTKEEIIWCAFVYPFLNFSYFNWNTFLKILIEV